MDGSITHLRCQRLAEALGGGGPPRTPPRARRQGRSSRDGKSEDREAAGLVLYPTKIKRQTAYRDVVDMVFVIPERSETFSAQPDVCDRPVEQPLSSCLAQPSGYGGRPYSEAERAARMDAPLFACPRGRLCAAYVSRTAVPSVPQQGLGQIPIQPVQTPLSSGPGCRLSPLLCPSQILPSTRRHSLKPLPLKCSEGFVSAAPGLQERASRPGAFCEST